MKLWTMSSMMPASESCKLRSNHCRWLSPFIRRFTDRLRRATTRRAMRRRLHSWQNWMKRARRCIRSSVAQTSRVATCIEQRPAAAGCVCTTPRQQQPLARTRASTRTSSMEGVVVVVVVWSSRGASSVTCSRPRVRKRFGAIVSLAPLRVTDRHEYPHDDGAHELKRALHRVAYLRVSPPQS